MQLYTNTFFKWNSFGFFFETDLFFLEFSKTKKNLKRKWIPLVSHDRLMKTAVLEYISNRLKNSQFKSQIHWMPIWLAVRWIVGWWILFNYQTRLSSLSDVWEVFKTRSPLTTIQWMKTRTNFGSNLASKKREFIKKFFFFH